MSLKVVLTFILAVAGLAQTPPAFAEGANGVVIYGPTLPPKNCSPRLAHRVTITDLNDHPDRYARTCVRVAGLFNFRTLYDGVAGYYRAGPTENNLLHADAERYRIGLYMTDRDFKRAPGPVIADVIGVAWTCAALGQDQPNVIMVLGWCHMNGGSFLAVRRFRVMGPARIVRHIGARARADLGDFTFAPADWPDTAAVRAFAMRWITDIATGNIGDFHELVSNIDPKIDAYVFRAAHSPFVTFRGRRQTPQLAIFLPRPITQDIQMPHKGVDPDELREVGVFCFCRVANCTPLWPIGTIDAGAAPDRPYICASEWTWNRKPTAEFEIDRRKITEPRL